MKAKPEANWAHQADEVVTRAEEEWLEHEVAGSNLKDAGWSHDLGRYSIGCGAGRPEHSARLPAIGPKQGSSPIFYQRP